MLLFISTNIKVTFGFYCDFVFIYYHSRALCPPNTLWLLLILFYIYTLQRTPAHIAYCITISFVVTISFALLFFFCNNMNIHTFIFPLCSVHLCFLSIFYATVAAFIQFVCFLFTLLTFVCCFGVVGFCILFHCFMLRYFYCFWLIHIRNARIKTNTKSFLLDARGKNAI